MAKFTFIVLDYEEDDTFVVQGEAKDRQEAQEKYDAVIEQLMKQTEEDDPDNYGVCYVLRDGVIVERGDKEVWTDKMGLRFGNTPQEMHESWK